MSTDSSPCSVIARRRLPQRLLLFAALLGLLPGLLVPGRAAAAAATLNITPATGSCETRPELRGAGFPSGATVVITGERTTPPGEKGPQRAATATIRADGGFTILLLAIGGDCNDLDNRTPEGAQYRFVATTDGAASAVSATTAYTIRRSGAGSRFFPESGFAVEGRFLAYWEGHGGLALNGFPLSDEFPQRLEDGQTYLVQYFERSRLEYHPESADPRFEIQLGQFGRRALRAGDEFQSALFANPAEPRSGANYFTETGHNLSGRFLEYWRANGGLAQFGLPLTEAGEGYLKPDGPYYTVQYFERARFELHPENQVPYDVLLGGNLDIERLYMTTERLQGLIGRPTAPATTTAGSFRAFERGAMLWRGDTHEIYVLCGGDQRAGNDVQGPFADTWREGQAAGGGPGPRAGLYEPGRGFGKVWRDQPGVRDCLGYAIDATETTGQLDIQPFRRGTFDNLLFAASTPAGRVAYAAYYTFIGSSFASRTPRSAAPTTSVSPSADPENPAPPHPDNGGGAGSPSGWVEFARWEGGWWRWRSRRATHAGELPGDTRITMPRCQRAPRLALAGGRRVVPPRFASYA